MGRVIIEEYSKTLRHYGKIQYIIKKIYSSHILNAKLKVIKNNGGQKLGSIGKHDEWNMLSIINLDWVSNKVTIKESMDL